MVNIDQFITMPAGQIKAMSHPEQVNMSSESPGAQWKVKLEESKVKSDLPYDDPGHHRFHGAGVYDSIKETGKVNTPVTLYRDMPAHSIAHPGNRPKSPVESINMGDGHHRVAAAADIDPNMPVPTKQYFDPQSLPSRTYLNQARRSKARKRAKALEWGSNG